MIVLEHNGQIFYLDRRDYIDPEGLSKQLWGIIATKKQSTFGLEQSYYESIKNLFTKT